LLYIYIVEQGRNVHPAYKYSLHSRKKDLLPSIPLYTEEGREETAHHHLCRAETRLPSIPLYKKRSANSMKFATICLTWGVGCWYENSLGVPFLRLMFTVLYSL
jgi:hypothetical protein